MVNSSIAAAPAGPIAGLTVVGERGITETVEQIMLRERLDAATRGLRPPRMKREREVEREHLPQHPAAQAISRFPRTGLLDRNADFRDPGAFAAQTVDLDFNGVSGPSETGAFPPDTDGAVGPTQYVVAVNGRFRTFDKATGLADGALDVDSDVFFAPVMTAGANFTSDPHVRYDRLSGRWIFDMIDVPGLQPGTKPNRIMIAVSSGPTIASSASFTYFQFTGDGTNFDDYPTLGIDANALYIGTNAFKTSGLGGFARTNGFVVRKSSILGAGPIVVTKFLGLAAGTGAGPYTPQGVDNYDPTATEGYFIGVDNASFGVLQIRRVSTPGGTPTISGNLTLAVSTTQYPIAVPQTGNASTMDALDDRLFAAHLRNGRLWTAHNIQVNSSGVASTNGGRNAARWYEIQNLTRTPSLVESGTVFDSATASPKSFWIPSIMVSGQGHAALGFSTSGLATHPNAGTAGRLAGDPLGTTQPPVDYTASTTVYNPADGGSPHRWGDYSYTSLDPSDDMTMWTIQEYCNGANSYGTRIAKLKAPPPATPSSASPSSVNTGQSSVLVTITGTSLAGSGFFDPPATGIVPAAKRISASVTGGVTVNSVSFTDATHVTLDLDTTGASTGPQDVTITNPDGQVMTGSGVLEIAGTSADLSLTKTDSPDPVIAGNNLTYTLTVHNAGPAAAQTVSVSDQLPVATTFLSVTAPAGWTSTAPAVGASGTVTFSSPVMASGSSAVLTILVRVKASTAGGTLIINSATVSSSTSDDAPDNNAASSTTTANRSADLVVTNSGTPNPVSAGQNVTYTVTVKDSGPSDAKNVVVTDALPAGETFVSASAPTGWSATTPAVGANGTVTFSKAAQGRSTTGTFTIVAQVSAAAADGTSIANTVSASSATADPNAANNSATATTTVGSLADLSVTIGDSPDPVFAGNNLTYTVTVKNAGATQASNVSLSEPLPGSGRFVSNSGAAGWSCTNPAANTTGTITCTVAALPSGASATFTIVVKVLSTVADGTIIKSKPTVTSSTTDPNAANNSATASTTVFRRADLAVTRTDSPDPVHAGQSITYKVKLTNNGPSTADGISLIDGVPAHTTFVSNSGATGWTCTNPAVGGTGTINCTAATMATATSKTFTIVVKVDGSATNGSTIDGATSVSAHSQDSDIANDSATSTTGVLNP